jgi:2-methylcitrate dehydratase PrpD
VDQAIARLQEAVLTLPERYLHLPRGEEITAGLQAKFSVQNAVAVGFVKGTAGPRDFSDDIASDPQIGAFRSVLKMVGDAEMARESAQMVAHLRDGASLTCHVEHGSGNPAHPMSYADIRAKLFEAGRDVIDAASLEKLATLAEHLEEIENVEDFVALTVAPAPRLGQR